jgi:hypothetical protein
MQSGLRNTRDWVVEFEAAGARFHDPLTGWVGSRDTRHQVRLRFATRDDAIAFAERNGYEYQVVAPTEMQHRPKSYAENFRRPN